ncbi:outer membrane protein assembly factor BamD [Sphingomonas sp. BE123]|jgi:outer membrane protein assembly factor BamD|uniref:outer membrane protein assembly factor BamD n=1 Tax=unclassified Sphingomonas TaxID=196159 RepID=UPI00285B9888|nr:outer membrane protein assembly factor BamD [Sphingomonas sp. BE123]MDR6851627.1 outer membrane protein assembly factor BamD [Sphingomonas sp. BE123]
MRTLSTRSLALAALAVLALPIAGCASNGGKRADLPYVARDVGTLYTSAKDRLDRGQYKLAAALFDEVERQHPYSVWARRAQLMGAFSYYLDKNYTQSIQSAQRFLAVHPGNRDAPYAYYLIALSYYEQISDVTRDQKITQQALDALGELNRRYPNTRYAADARLKIDLVRDHLAGKEMEVGRYYQVRGQWLASVIRFRSVVDQYQTTTHAPEALMRLTESYLALGVKDEAKKAAAVLGANYPGTEWYSRAYALVEQHGAPVPVPPLPTAIAPPARDETPSPAPASDETD